nr:hypothetical transcript [Hymenolepis microstoma]
MLTGYVQSQNQLPDYLNPEALLNSFQNYKSGELFNLTILIFMDIDSMTETFTLTFSIIHAPGFRMHS